ncbi:hypothetical protein AMJ57_02950 [Parcubacteria bacterium SG8_24]|nr:MAG: hypothetical protein AMJ57_02950 [Parcubacteria bacterium SG8_24]
MRNTLSGIRVGTLAALVAVALALPWSGIRAAGVFNPNYIISDEEIRDHQAMGYADIVMFLAERGGLNTCFDADAADGLLKSSAQLIDDAARRYRINPKYIMAVLQKESGIVEAAEPTQRQLDWAAGYALCDGCSRNSALAQKYKGFGKQVDVAAGWMDWYMTNAEELRYLKQPGETYTISNTQVTPINLATAGLYNYTPHLHGNKLLWSIWNRWFGDGPLNITYPEGTLVKNIESGAYAVIQASKFRPILNESVLTTRFVAGNAIELDDISFRLLESANPGRPVRFPDYALVRTENGETFLLVGDEKRRITSQEAFAKIGFNPEEVEEVLADDLLDYREGGPLGLDLPYPIGRLVQDTTTGGVYYAESGVKHPIWDRSILQANFTVQEIHPLSPETLAGLTDGEPVRFRDGTLIKAPDHPRVYVIADGMKRVIPSEEVFLGYGYGWHNILTATERALTLHETGDPLLLVEETVTAAAVGI